MKSNNKKDLIDHMAEQLREHRLPYREGAWEHFAKKHIDTRSVSKFSPWPYVTGVAAAILLGFGLFVWNTEQTGHDDKLITTTTLGDNRDNEGKIGEPDSEIYTDDTEGQLLGEGLVEDKALPEAKLTKSKRKSEKIKVDRLLTENSFSETELSTESKVTAYAQSVEVEKKLIDLGHHQESENQLVVADINEKENTLAMEQRDKSDNAVASVIATNEKSAMELMLEKEAIHDNRTKASTDKVDRGRKWGFGVAVSPLMTEEKINLGGGLTVAYQITDKLSVGSGLSVVDLNVSNNQVNGANNRQVLMVSAPAVDNYLESNTMAVTGNRELTSISSNVLGLDIPIDFRYKLTKKLFVGAGASVFTILSENRFNNYVSQFDNNQMIVAQGISANNIPAIRQVRTSEATAETPLKESGYSTFLNFSIGQQIPLSSRIGLSVEPFYKLPVGRINNQNMNFNYGGIRIITSF